MRDQALANKTLDKLQRDFGEALLGDSPDAALEWVVSDDRFAKDRLFIYRRNVQSSLLECLQRRFSRVATALGGAEFDRLALRFVREYPPDDEALVNYGRGFPAYLEGLDVGCIDAWLPSLAQLELYCHECVHERDDEPVTNDALSEISDSSLSTLRLQCQRALRAFSSDYNLLGVWEDRGRAPTEEACLMLIVREAYSPKLYCLQGGIRSIFECLQSGGTAAEAFATVANESEFTHALAKLVSMGVFSRLVI